MTSDQVIEAVLAKFEGQTYGDCVEGPHAIGPYDIWRVWAYSKRDDEYQAHYLIEKKGRSVHIFENFPPFAIWMDRTFDFDGLFKQRADMIRLTVASVILLMLAGLLSYIIVKDPSKSSVIAPSIMAVLGGAGGFLFGRNRSARPPT